MQILAATLLPLLLFFVLKSRLNICLFQLLIRRRRARDVLCGTACIYQAIKMPLPEPRTRRLWMRVRSKDRWDNVVLHHFTDEEWKENFRMTRQSFMTLCSMVEGNMAPGEATVRAPIPLTAVRHTSLRDLYVIAHAQNYLVSFSIR